LIKPCLFDNLAFGIRELGAREAIYAAVGLKPEKGTINTINKFNNIGG
jgi:hypothetical protein